MNHPLTDYYNFENIINITNFLKFGNKKIFSFLIEIRADASMQNVYIPSHTRATVFLIGMITAYHLFEKKNSTWRMSWVKIECFKNYVEKKRMDLG